MAQAGGRRGLDPVVVMGASGCGRSGVGDGLARVLNRPLIEGGSLHPAANIRKMRAGTPLDDEDRRPWLDRVRQRLGEPRVVVSRSALKRLSGPAAPAGGVPRDPRLSPRRRGVPGSPQAGRQRRYMPLSLLDSQLAVLDLSATGRDAEPDIVAIDADQPLEAIAATALALPTVCGTAAPHNASRNA